MQQQLAAHLPAIDSQEETDNRTHKRQQRKAERLLKLAQQVTGLELQLQNGTINDRQRVKLERMKTRQSRIAEREQRKQLKQLRKVEKVDLKKQKKEKKQERNTTIDDIDLSGNIWPGQIKTVYLDGNNMLFLTNTLRQYAIKKSGRSIAENILTKAGESFHIQHPTVKMTHVLFDNTNTSINTLVAGRSFVVSAARPIKPTSDDLLVEFAQQAQNESQSCLFVTSDRELRRRLQQYSPVIKPGKFMDYIFRQSMFNSSSNYKTLDQWIQQFVQH
jgi:hypothetical protein